MCNTYSLGLTLASWKDKEKEVGWVVVESTVDAGLERWKLVDCEWDGSIGRDF